ncbi:hypothetical protein CRG98_048806, partial [Punica granatum]
MWEHTTGRRTCAGVRAGMRAGASRRQEHAGVRQSGGRLLGVRSVRWSASVC